MRAAVQVCRCRLAAATACRDNSGCKRTAVCLQSSSAWNVHALRARTFVSPTPRPPTLPNLQAGQ